MNCTVSPSAADIAVWPSCTSERPSDWPPTVAGDFSDTLTDAVSVIVDVLVAAVSTVTVRVSVVAELSFTTSVSFGSSTRSVSVAIVIVPLLSPAVIVSFPLGAV